MEGCQPNQLLWANAPLRVLRYQGHPEGLEGAGTRCRIYYRTLPNFYSFLDTFTRALTLSPPTKASWATLINFLGTKCPDLPHVLRLGCWWVGTATRLRQTGLKSSHRILRIRPSRWVVSNLQQATGTPTQKKIRTFSNSNFLFLNC